MGLFKKEEKKELSELPDLPPLPSLPEFSEQRQAPELRQRNNLPSFPSSPSGDRFSQSAIKTAIAPPPQEEENEGEEDFEEFSMSPPRAQDFQPSKFAPPQSPPQIPAQIISPPRMTLPLIQPRAIPVKEKSDSFTRQSQSESPSAPIFIRIDKFEKAQDNFKAIKSEVHQISQLLAEIKEKRTKEEAELSEWERQVEEIKSKISIIDSELFGKLN